MKFIISPAKTMNVDTDTFAPQALPRFLEQAEELKNYLQSLDYAACKALWNCSDALAEANFERLQKMDLHRSLTPALFAYEGIQYQYMAPGVFTEEELDYVQEHLRILSGLYGLLCPLDGVTPYRPGDAGKTGGISLQNTVRILGQPAGRCTGPWKPTVWWIWPPKNTANVY